MDSEVIDIEMAYWRAINAFATETSAAIARKIVWRLMRTKATGIFSDDYRHKTLWDEICHNQQNGSFDEDIDFACDDIIRRKTDELLLTISASTLTLLTLANPDFSPEEQGQSGEPEYVYTIIKQTVSEIAGSRDLYRFESEGD